MAIQNRIKNDTSFEKFIRKGKSYAEFARKKSTWYLIQIIGFTYYFLFENGQFSFFHFLIFRIFFDFFVER